MAEAEAKMRGGKLACVNCEKRGNFFNVTLSGDFFMHPEEGVHLIEKTLSGIPKDATVLAVRHAVDGTLAENGIRMYGIDRDIIVALYEDARSMESRRADGE